MEAGEDGGEQRERTFLSEVLTVLSLNSVMHVRCLYHESSHALEARETRRWVARGESGAAVESACAKAEVVFQTQQVGPSCPCERGSTGWGYVNPRRGALLPV